MTRVSIITPNYNSNRRSFEFSIDSLEAQTCRDFEWIVVDDGSTEAPSFNVTVALGNNYGPSAARNVGFQISSGDIITYLDMGDELAPDRVENLINLFDKYQPYLMFSAYNIVNTDGLGGTFDHFSWIGKSSKFPTSSEYLRLLQYQNISIPLGVAHTRKVFVDAGGFQRGIVCGEDGILWRRMVDMIAQPSKILFSNDVAGIYHISENGQSRTQRRFEMGGFAFDGSKNDNGRYLDETWYKTYGSEEWYEQLER